MKILETSSKGKGLAVGKAFVVRSSEGTATVWGQCSFGEALEKATSELEVLSESSEIFAAHLEMIQDPIIAETFESKKDDWVDDATACREACEEICQMFQEIDDEYLRSRVDDVRDVFRRIIRHINGESDINPFEQMPDGCIIVADELAPSDTAGMDLSKVLGFVTAKGSTTSHVCIIAATNGIAASVGVRDCMQEIKDGMTVIVDSPAGKIILDPDDATEQKYRDSIAKVKARLSSVKASGTARTKAGREVPVMANAGNPDEVKTAMEAGADGIGLLRSEFLYMQSEDFPTEEQQFAAYKEAAMACGTHPLTIRTLDIGGDKALKYLSFPKEENPFLGYRAIRVSLSMPAMFKAQLRAILRASAFGNVRIMFPMITSVPEFNQARDYVDKCKEELRDEGIPFDEKIKIGVMIETPAAVMVADELASAADFFSIGTNDLTQYLMCADRGNSAVLAFYDYFSEPVVRAIRLTIEGAHAKGIECCMCGEMAGNPAATALLLNLGLDSFSVSAPNIPEIKDAIVVAPNSH